MKIPEAFKIISENNRYQLTQMLYTTPKCLGKQSQMVHLTLTDHDHVLYKGSCNDFIDDNQINEILDKFDLILLDETIIKNKAKIRDKKLNELIKYV
jgi:hypothetical protein